MTNLSNLQRLESQSIHILREVAAEFERPVVDRDGQLIMVDDDRFPLADGETPAMEMVRFRTLGCNPLTAAVRSTAVSIDELISETDVSRPSERHGRTIDRDQSASMEKKKCAGYC